jgi:hypothetical protein
MHLQKKVGQGPNKNTTESYWDNSLSKYEELLN